MFHGHKSEQCPLMDVLDDAIYSSEEYAKLNIKYKEDPEFNSIFDLFIFCSPNTSATKETITVT